jgi:hypothetical protein
MAPRRRVASIDGDALRINATWSSARLGWVERNKITDGEVASRSANRVPKSVSVETIIRDSRAARAKTPSSDAACIV